MTLPKRKASVMVLKAQNTQMDYCPPIHYKKEIDEIVPHKQRMAWESLRKDIAKHGLRHPNIISTDAPETVSNETNGIEPKSITNQPRKVKGPLKQIVPGFPKLKNAYTLLWDMPNNQGYINVVAMMQKYFDQAILQVTGVIILYNMTTTKCPPAMVGICFPIQVWLENTYYQNTYDFKGEEEDVQPRN